MFRIFREGYAVAHRRHLSRQQRRKLHQIVRAQEVQHQKQRLLWLRQQSLPRLPWEPVGASVRR